MRMSHRAGQIAALAASVVAFLPSCRTPPAAEAATPTSTFVAAIRAEFPAAQVQVEGGEIVVALEGKTARVTASHLERQCPAGPGPGCDAAIREVVRTTARDLREPPTCNAKSIEPALLMRERNDTGLSAAVVGRLHVGAASYFENRSLRVWCTAEEAGMSPERLLVWAREQAKALPPPPIEPMANHTGIWTIIEKRNVSLYFLDPERISAAIVRDNRATIAAVVPNEHIVLITSSDRKDLVKELRKAAEVHSVKAGAASGLSNEVYELTPAGWRVLPE